MRIVTAVDEPALVPAMRELGGSPWHEFLLHSRVMNRLFGRLYDMHPELQFAGLSDDDGSLLAVGNCVPVHWRDGLERLPDSGVEWAMIAGYETPGAGPANLLSAVQIAVQKSHLGSGLSTPMVAAMREIARKHGLPALVAPVRPVWKARYPLVPMEQYVQWTRADGHPYDPWMRVHTKLGARILRVCHASLTVEGTRDDWQSWTGLWLPESGDYVVDGGLVPVRFDVAKNLGRYVEPNVWMLHP